MKYTLLIFLSWWLFTSAPIPKETHYFEGYKITKHYYESKRLNTDSLAAHNTSGSFYYYNNKYYKGYSYSAKDTSIYVYNSDINQCLWYDKGDKSLQCMSYGEPLGPVLKKAYEKPNRVKVKDLDCRVIVMEYEDHVNTYYVTDKYRYNPALYRNHVAFYYKKRMKMADGGMVMRAEIKYRNYTKIIETTEVVEEEVPDTEFLLLWFQRCP